MKLIDQVTLAEIQLPNSLLWKDEFDWTPVAATGKYSLGGSFIVQAGTKLSGRPITLEPMEDMGWVSRAKLATLYAAASIPKRKFTLALEYPDDTREFTVWFAPVANPVEAKPVKGFPEHSPDSWYSIKLQFIQTE